MGDITSIITIGDDDDFTCPNACSDILDIADSFRLEQLQKADYSFPGPVPFSLTTMRFPDLSTFSR